MRRRPAPALLLALAVLVAGCGGGSAHRTGAPRGQVIFKGACGSCHTLTGHNDGRHQGGDLLGFRATRAQFLQFAAEMPVRHPLSQAQLEAVTRYVMALENRPR